LFRSLRLQVSKHFRRGNPRIPEEINMKDPVYKIIELTGTSTTSIEDAVGKAINRAHKTIKNLRWFQVIETRGNIEKGKVHHWQVTVKIGFAVNE
jgi:flavin-binding protein dodecin